MPIRSRLLAHEWLFGGFMAVLTTGLLLRGAWRTPDFAVCASFLAANGLLLAWAVRGDEDWRWRIRLLFYVVAMNVLFQRMATAVPLVNPWNADSFLHYLDRLLIGENLSLRMQPFICRPLTEVMSFCYILFLPYLTISLFLYLLGRPDQARPFYAGLFTLYGIGFLGYLLFPARGPIDALAAQFSVPLEGGWLTRWTAETVEKGSNHVDAFPSLHCAVSFYLLLSDRRYHRWRFWSYLLPAAGLWVSTIYLRYHYLVDVLAGFTLSIFCLWVSRITARQEQVHALRPSL